MKTALLSRFAGILALVLASPVFATLISQPLGTAAPPSNLGGFTMAGFPLDPRPIGAVVTEVLPPGSAPVTGPLGFDYEVTHYKVGSGWATWSHGYTGDVYAFEALLFGDTLTLTLPVDTKSFYLYVEPDFFDVFTFTVTSGTTFQTLDINGEAGAAGVGFYTDDPATESLLSVLVTKTDPTIPFFAVGEFGINSGSMIPPVPDGSIPPLLTGAVLFAIGAFRRWIKE